MTVLIHKKFWLYSLLILSGLIILWSIGIWWYASSLETPSYKVIAQKQGYEIRLYDSVLVAEVTVKDTGYEGLNDGFRQLAGFIFGKNQKSQNIQMTTPVTDIPSQTIAMTSPVLDQPRQGGRSIRFSMPKKWTKETLPKPLNKNIKFIRQPPVKKAVQRFMLLSTSNMAKRKEIAKRFLETLKKDKLRHKGDITFAFYNPPYTPFFLRRNEVMVTLKDNN